MQRQDDRGISLNLQSESSYLRSDLVSPKRSDLVVFFLVFILLLTFSIHNFDSIGQDIGRHLKIGEIIWQTKIVPATNLFSFTEPDFPFLNHHWLSEAIFYKLHDWFGFMGLILIKALLILAAFAFLFSIVKNRGKFWPILISFLLSIFVFISRTEVRPEIFSFVILAFFLFVLFRAKYSSRSDLKNPQGRTLDTEGRTLNLLWLLPVAELLWVNLHIYFFIGPFLLAAFLVDQFFTKRFDLGSAKRSNLGKLILIFLLTSLATLINPHGLAGALVPFNILKEYGYSIVENQTLSFLASFFGFNLFIFAFKLSVGVLLASFVLTLKKVQQRIFEILISVFFIYAGFKMLRNLPLYALASFPVLAFLLTDIQNSITKVRPGGFLRSNLVSNVFKLATAVFLIFMIFFTATNSFYERLSLSRAFGLAIPDGLERATDFVKENKIKGPMFNNFDIGGYLIWKLYPDEKVFVDNRPEAYSVKFFSEIYKPMQEDKVKWEEFSEKYGINFIFFGHTDMTPWGQAFLKDILKDPSWKIVYLNENAVILVNNNQANSEIIARWAITEGNAAERAAGDNLVLSRFFYNISWRKAALHFADEAIKADPTDRHAYLNKGLTHAYYTDAANQKLAGESIKKAIDLGLKNSQYYTILGIVYMNLGRLDEAENWFKKALELDDKNEQARQFLSKYFTQPVLNLK